MTKKFTENELKTLIEKLGRHYLVYDVLVDNPVAPQIKMWDIGCELYSLINEKDWGRAPFLGDVLPESFIAKCERVFGIADCVLEFDTVLLETPEGLHFRVTRWPETLEDSMVNIKPYEWVDFRLSCPRGAETFSFDDLWKLRGHDREMFKAASESDYRGHIRSVKDQILYLPVFDKYLSEKTKKGFRGFACGGIVPVTVNPGWSETAITFWMHNTLSQEMVGLLLSMHPNQVEGAGDAYVHDPVHQNPDTYLKFVGNQFNGEDLGSLAEDSHPVTKPDEWTDAVQEARLFKMKHPVPCTLLRKGLLLTPIDRNDTEDWSWSNVPTLLRNLVWRVSEEYKEHYPALLRGLEEMCNKIDEPPYDKIAALFPDWQELLLENVSDITETQVHEFVSRTALTMPSGLIEAYFDNECCADSDDPSLKDVLSAGLLSVLEEGFWDRQEGK